MLHLLQAARFERSTGVAVELERKTAALLALLAIEGPTGRSRLAGLLWPDAGEERARANLRQLLSRLRKAAGEDLVESDPLRLVPRITVDLHVDSLLSGESAGFEAGERILAGMEFPDCPELSDWLDAASERQRRQLLAALEAAADVQEAAGEFTGAVERARRLLALDPFSERSHRRLIRLHYLLGDRAAALRAYEVCAMLLADELGVSPLPETRELARLVKSGDAGPAAVQRPSTTLPLSVLRPPKLVGREREWERMEQAWAAGRAIFVSGPAGIGKSRLALDFASAKGPVMVLDSRPGDAAVPFASQARAVRQVLRTWPDLELPGWVRQELARLIPELGVDPAPPIAGEIERVRFYEAQVELLRALGTGLTVFVDNLQFCDPASGALGHFMFSNQPVAGAPIRPIFAFRRGELPAVVAESMAALVDNGIAELVELSPLPPADVGALVEQLGIPALGEVPAQAAGGNPALLLELIKGHVQGGAPQEGAPVPRDVEQILRARIRRLSVPAQRLAVVAALAGDLLDVELAVAALGLSAFDLAAPWQELEEAQILHGIQFAHDLLQEAAIAEVPVPIVKYIHRSIATHLEKSGGDPTSLALHWQAAGDEHRAAPFLQLLADAV